MNESAEKESIRTERGFSEAVTGCERLLFSVSFTVLNDRELCADAVQNAVLKAWKRIGTLRDPAKFKSWLVRIVLNECMNLKKKPSPLPLTEDIPAETRDRDASIDVRRAVTKLDEKYRIPVALYYFEEMPVGDIAAAMGIPKGTVLSRLSRARDILRKELMDYDEGLQK